MQQTISKKYTWQSLGELQVQLLCTICILMLFSLNAKAQHTDDDDLMDEEIEQEPYNEDDYYQDDAATLFEADKNDIRNALVGTARNYWSIAASASLPESDYQRINNNLGAGFANSGWAVSADLGIMLSKNIGISASAQYHNNPINEDGYLQLYSNRLPKQSIGLELQTEAWQNFILAVGPYASLPENKITFDLRVLFGAALSTMPENTIRASYQNEPAIDLRKADKAISPAYVVGANISYLLPASYNLRILLKGEFVGAKPEFKVSQHTQAYQYSLLSTYTYKQSINTFSVGLGLRYEFGYAK